MRISRAFRRYLLLELPGWGLAAVVVWVVVDRGLLGAAAGAALLALWMAKDLALYPWLRDAYEPGDPDPAAALVGRPARVTERLAPSGKVRLGSELWRAELPPGSAPVEVGATVRVSGLRGLTLRVEAES